MSAFPGIPVSHGRGTLCGPRRRFDTAHWVIRDFSVLARPTTRALDFPIAETDSWRTGFRINRGLRTRPMPGTGMVIALASEIGDANSTTGIRIAIQHGSDMDTLM
jgi:hypothetical protein